MAFYAIASAGGCAFFSFPSSLISQERLSKVADCDGKKNKLLMWLPKQLMWLLFLQRSKITECDAQLAAAQLLAHRVSGMPQDTGPKDFHF